MAESPEELLKRLQSEHGPIAMIKPKIGPVLYFKPLTVEASDRWFDKVSGDVGSKPAATRECVLSLLVHPTRDEARKVFTAFPALAPAINRRLREEAGVGAEVVVETIGGVERATVHTDHGSIVCRCPTEADHEAWLQRCTDDKSGKPAFTREYVLSSLADKSKREEAEAILAKLPVLAETISVALAKMAGADIEVEIKKA